MSEPVYTGTINIVNDAQLPIVNIAVAHWQDFGGSKQNFSVHEFALVHPHDPIPSFQVNYTNEHENYWVIAWQNKHDPAIYYLIEAQTLWQKIEEVIFKGINKALAELLDVCTESDLGAVFKKAANLFVTNVFENNNKSARIQNKINTEANKRGLTISLCSDRQKAKLHSSGHDTACNVQYYLMNTNNYGAYSC